MSFRISSESSSELKRLPIEDTRETGQEELRRAIGCLGRMTCCKARGLDEAGMRPDAGGRQSAVLN